MSIPIAKPPWTLLGKRLESSVRKALFDFALVENVPHVAVALSGGKDSLSLLFLLKAISGKGFSPFQISAIHVDGEFSCGAGVDKSFLKAICKELNIPLIIKKIEQKKETIDCYSCSRKRRSLIFKTAKENNIFTVAFGHHKDDSAQTLLLNLLQKGEFSALLPKIFMYNYGITIIRPLIYIEEEKIKKFAGHYGFQRISCQCPIGQNSRRKQLDQLLTQIEELFPNVRSNLALSGLLYGSDKAAKLPSTLRLSKKNDTMP